MWRLYVYFVYDKTVTQTKNKENMLTNKKEKEEKEMRRLIVSLMKGWRQLGWNTMTKIEKKRKYVNERKENEEKEMRR